MKRWLKSEKEAPVAEKPEPESEETEHERKKAEANAELAEYKEQDRQDSLDARFYVPPVAAKEYTAGSFLCCGNQEWPRRFIESIEANNQGCEPWLETSWFYHTTITPMRGRASVRLTMASGQKHYVECNRFQRDPRLDALRHAWKTGKAAAE